MFPYSGADIVPRFCPVVQSTLHFSSFSGESCEILDPSPRDQGHLFGSILHPRPPVIVVPRRIVESIRLRFPLFLQNAVHGVIRPGFFREISHRSACLAFTTICSSSGLLRLATVCHSSHRSIKRFLNEDSDYGRLQWRV
jgi:hypothetical protein